MNDQSLVTRVNRLERENRRMKLAGVLVLLGIVAVMMIVGRIWFMVGLYLGPLTEKPGA